MNRNPHITILLSYMLIILSACITLTLVSFKSKSKRLFKVPVIINNAKGSPVCLAPNFMMAAVHPIERIQKFDDTLDLASEPAWPRAKYFQLNSDKNDPENYFNDEGLKVIVDTESEISTAIRPGMPSVEGFPVYIINQATQHTAQLETQNGKLKMIVEAFSSKNSWEPIEYLTEPSEKQSEYILKLPPQHYALTSNIIHCGDHITKCRLKLMSGNSVYYSNQFWMGVNYTQFEKM
jgi:hypothetical protein